MVTIFHGTMSVDHEAKRRPRGLEEHEIRVLRLETTALLTESVTVLPITSLAVRSSC